MENKKTKKIIILVAIILVACIALFAVKGKKEEKKKEKEVEIVGNYNVDIIKTTYSETDNENYLISPYNIEIALNMLRDGANGKTKEEIDKVIGNRTINDVSIKDKLNIANAVFIKDIYKDDVKKDYMNILDKNYKAEVLYDKFETPDVINNWVKEKTNGMIPKILDNISKDYVMGLASALALDVEWDNAFECIGTTSEEFTKANKDKMQVEMMHKEYTYNAKYIKNDEMEGIILPYQTDEKELEFVAILPKDGVDNYISNLTEDKLKNITNGFSDATSKMHVNLSLPRFTYDYDVKDFIKVLKTMGIVAAFDEVLADFSKMIQLDENVYVSTAIHKTKIELNEKGTKAAAVTYFGLEKATGLFEKDYEEVDIKFNKPFVYMIREKATGEILFFGTVFEPNEWKGSTCSNPE